MGDERRHRRSLDNAWERQLVLSSARTEVDLRRRYVQFVIDCPLRSEVVFDALTDFSEKRVQYFPNLSRANYAVIERDAKTALVREGTGPFFTTERYDWSTAGRIWSVIEESNVAMPGGMTDIRITTRSDGWCRLNVDIDRQFYGWKGTVIDAAVVLNGKKRFFRRTYIRMLKNVQRASRKAVR